MLKFRKTKKTSECYGFWSSVGYDGVRFEIVEMDIIDNQNTSAWLFNRFFSDNFDMNEYLYCVSIDYADYEAYLPAYLTFEEAKKESDAFNDFLTSYKDTDMDVVEILKLYTSFKADEINYIERKKKFDEYVSGLEKRNA